MKNQSITGQTHGPYWIKWLESFIGKPVRGLELGTFKGESAEWMLDNICIHPESHYYCVDTFKGSAEHEFHKIDVSETERLTKERLARFSNVSIHRATTNQFLNWFRYAQMRDKYLDFIYVDADHSARGVLRDAVLSFEILKVGGIMIFDDYLWREMPHYLDRPGGGIDAFTVCYARQLEELARGSQICVKKVAP